MATFGNLENRMAIYADRVSRNARSLNTKIGRTVHRKLVEATPVDTGRARSNWIVTTGSPTGIVIPPYAPGRHLGRSETANAAAAIRQAEAALAARAPEATIYIQNNVAYLARLNAGSSKQAPAGFVQKAITQAAEKIAQTRLLDSRRP